MAYEIINSIRGSSIVRCVDVSTANLTLTQFRASPNTETVSALTIRKVNWSTNGTIEVTRDGAQLLKLSGSGEMRLDDFGGAMANTSTGNLSVQIFTGGCIVLEVSKIATYNVDPYTGQTT
jgi:hypothetical protein